MGKDIFGNLTEWGNVLDQIEHLRQSCSLDEHQSGLIRILRYKDNWKLRETVLSCLTDLKNPCEETLDEVLGIMMDEGTYYDQRVLAAECLGYLAGIFRPASPMKAGETYPEKAVERMDQLLKVPQPPILHKALQKAIRQINTWHECSFEAEDPRKS